MVDGDAFSDCAHVVTSKLKCEKPLFAGDVFRSRDVFFGMRIFGGKHQD